MQFKYILSVSMLLAFGKLAEAQQIFTLSQFTQHNFIINPAAAGASDHSSIGGTYRKMWASMAGGPQTTILFGDTYFAKKNVGVAIALYDDKTGPTSRTGGQLNLSYSINMDKGRRLMFGLGGNFLQYHINKEMLAVYIPNDPLLASAADNVIKGDAAAGVYYKSSTLNIGFSVQQLIQAKFNYIKTNTNPEGKMYRHYYLMGSYNLKTDEDNVVIPNVLVQYLPNAPIDFTAGVRLEHKDLLWVGFGYHYQQGYTAQVGLKIAHQLAIGYAYDQYKTPLSFFDDGSAAHEISLRYYFKK